MKQGRPLTPWLFALLLAVYLVTGGGHGYSVDGGFGYEMAKTALLDPQHEYFHRFKSAFARWGALMPLLGQPLVLTGEAIARVAPERDAVTVAGHRFRVEEWPAVGPGGQQAYVGPPPRVAVTQIAIVSFTANSAAVPQGTTVGEVRLVGDQTVTWPIRAGIETAEWAHDRPDVSNLMRHDQPRMAGHWIGQPRGNLYVATYAWPTPMVIERWELGAPLQANLPSGLTWNVRAAAFMDSDRVWHDVYTGERYWSPRQTHDFFTRLIYSTLNAFTTGGSSATPRRPP